MTIKEDTIVYPTPDEALIADNEDYWRQVLPEDYKNFIMKYNGGEPEEKTFFCHNHYYALLRFLCMLRDPQASPYGYHDIDVVDTQIGERLTANGDLVGAEVLPIGALFAGDYLCLDFREDKNNPSVCVWSHEESGPLDPTTYRVADSFTDFINMLY